MTAMRKLKKLLPGRDFRDDISVNPRYASPCTDLYCHDELFGGVPDILDPSRACDLNGLCLAGDWDVGERGRSDHGGYSGDQFGSSSQPRAALSLPSSESSTPRLQQGRFQRWPLPRAVSETRAQGYDRAYDRQAYDDLLVSRASSIYPRADTRADARPRYDGVRYARYDDSDFQVYEDMDDCAVQYSIRPKWTSRMRDQWTRVRHKKPFKKNFYIEPQPQDSPVIEEVPDLDSPLVDAANSALLIRSVARSTVVMRPVDSLADLYPNLIGPILVLESAMISFALYEIYVLLDGVFKTLKALCVPLLLVAKLVGL